MRFIVLLLIALIAGARTIAETIIEYAWWKEIGQVPVWLSQMLYGAGPGAAATVLAAVVLWIAFARGLKFGGSGLRHLPFIARISPLAALAAGAFVAAIAVDRQDVIRYIGGGGMTDAAAWRDPVFGNPLSFYLFDLPFWRVLHRFVLASSVAAALVFWISARYAGIRRGIEEMRVRDTFDPRELGLDLGLESLFLRCAAALFLLSLAVNFFLSRYDLLFSDHRFMVGVDWTDEVLRLPLRWIAAAASVAAAAAIFSRRVKTAVAIVAVAAVAGEAVPMVVSAVYVRPNEINIERPYIARHIEATRSAYGLSTRVTETDFAAKPGTRINVAANKILLDNVRLWDWRPFHDTVTQIQALRPYYVFADTDVDRYTIGGQLRQVLLTPRELDIRQLPDARTRWINPHFIYTHGYGMVMAEANRITADGMPVFLVQDAPPKIHIPELKLTRPEIYYGEVTHEPVIVRTSQKEFSYPTGAESAFTRYEGKGGFPMGSFGMRLAAAIRDGDFNLMLTNLTTPDSRMMIHRKVMDRLETAADFLSWDEDPYLVLTDEGRLVWTADAYTTSDSHPYSQHFRMASGARINYMRNSVKATVDAYDGTVHLYVFDAGDPIVRAYQRLFPTLLEPAAAMPEGLRAHARYPEAFFQVQAEIYRTYHMRDPQAFYNKEDVWEVARKLQQRGSRAPLQPTYVVAVLPGETKPEFLLTLPFTPRGKDNLIGLMVARCDGPALGELRVLQLSKQDLIFGPMQIDARIDQDPEISKDLTLWNQQGSEVLRGQMLVLPMQETFVYVEPIYLQASQARMPQLKKVVVAVGNDLVYRNTYDEAIAAIGSGGPAAAVPAAAPGAPAGTPAVVDVKPSAEGDRRVTEIRQRLRRYRELWSQGKYSEAGRELEAVEALAK